MLIFRVWWSRRAHPSSINILFLLRWSAITLNCFLNNPIILDTLSQRLPCVGLRLIPIRPRHNSPPSLWSASFWALILYSDWFSVLCNFSIVCGVMGVKNGGYYWCNCVVFARFYHRAPTSECLRCYKSGLLLRHSHICRPKHTRTHSDTDTHKLC